MTALRAALGDVDTCVDILTDLMSIPSELTISQLEVDPIWDNVRLDPAFANLMAFYREVDPNG